MSLIAKREEVVPLRQGITLGRELFREYVAEIRVEIPYIFDYKLFTAVSWFWDAQPDQSFEVLSMLARGPSRYLQSSSFWL
jgi:hypothetical protein